MKAILFVFALISIQCAFCNPNARFLELHNSRIDTRSLPSLVRDEVPNGAIRRDVDTTRRGYYIHLKHAANPQQIATIEAFVGVKLDTYIPHNTYLVYITRETALGAQSLDHVLWVGEFAPEHKVPNHFGDDAHKSINVLLVPYTGRTSAETFNIAKKWARLTGQKTEVLDVDKIHVEISKKKDVKKTISIIADEPESYYFENAAKYESHNYYASTVIQSNNNTVNPFPMYDNYFNGTNQVIGLADTGLDYTSCFLGSPAVPTPTFNPNAAKIVRYITTYGDTQDDDGHGTAVGGTIAGFEASHSTTGNGINYNAKLHFNDIKKAGQALSPPSNLADLLSPAYNDGVKIFVLPFGAGANWYNSDSVAIDKFTSSNDMLVIVSAGNTPGNKSLSGIALSKNALVVGASMSTNAGVAQGYSGSTQATVLDSPGIFGSHVLCNFSSVGPTPDGRIKPDVVAPAQAISTAQRGNTCGTRVVTGSSYAAGVAASAASIVREYFTSFFFPSGYRNTITKFLTEPTSDLLKAILINSGQSLSLVGADSKGQYASLTGIPDPRQGYGRIQLDKTLYLTNPQSTRSLLISPIQRDPLVTGAERNYCIKTTNAVSTVKATLVWMDKDGSPVSGHLLVNDLDLYIMDTNGVVYKPASGNGYWDSSNNVEQIEMFNIPMNSGFAVRVNARNVPVGPQNWTLVMSGDIVQDALCTATAGVCPGSCSGAGTCDEGTCICNSGRTGADCSIDVNACPSTNGAICAGNGDCDYGTGLCICRNNYEEPSCASLKVSSTSGSTSDPVVFTPAKNGYSKGLLAGCIIAAFFVGAIISIFLGGFLAVKYLEYRRDKAAKERSEEMQT